MIVQACRTAKSSHAKPKKQSLIKNEISYIYRKNPVVKTILFSVE
jgi:hypothetical protein